MDIVVSIVGPVIAEFFPFNINKTIKLKSNLDDLDQEMKNLMGLREHIKNQLVSEAKQEEKPETSKAEEWLREVEDLERKANSTRENLMERNKDKDYGWISDFKWRCRLSRKVVIMLEEVKRLQSSAKLEPHFTPAEARSP